MHGAIDARVRDLAPASGELLHAGRSRNDQVATTLLLYAADRANKARAACADAAATLHAHAVRELDAGTMLAGTTHWQPAQPVLLAFWLCAAALPLVRAGNRMTLAQAQATTVCPLGSAALAGSSLPLDRDAAAAELGFAAPSINAMDAIGDRDAAFDVAHAFVRALVAASRISEELVIWCTPQFGYARLGDAASTGSSLMPQKRNPDPFELVRALSADAIGRYAGALASTSGVALSYHRDLQIAKRAVIEILENGVGALQAFAAAIAHVTFDRARMNALAGESYTVATDVADALVLQGTGARTAHAEVGQAIAAHERGEAAIDWPDANASINGKRTFGSTHPEAVRLALSHIASGIARSASMTRVHVYGASGYASAELIRLLHTHPNFHLGAIESASHAGEPLAAHFPHLRDSTRVFDSPGAVHEAARSGDAVVFGAAHGVARKHAPALIDRGVRVVDLSGDFRLSPTAAVYGFPERYRDAIAHAALVANPGCYPTATLLATLPLAPFKPTHIVVDAKSGITGAGRTPAVNSLFAEVEGEVRAYGLSGHRHEPEIAQEWRAAGIDASLTFTPHVVPLARGMLVDAYAFFAKAPHADAVRASFRRSYAGDPSVRLLDRDRAPSLRAVRETNDAEIHVHVTDSIVRVICAIDNLRRGAASQALVNLNLMFGYPKELGIDARAVA